MAISYMYRMIGTAGAAPDVGGVRLLVDLTCWLTCQAWMMLYNCRYIVLTTSCAYPHFPFELL